MKKKVELANMETKKYILQVLGRIMVRTGDIDIRLRKSKRDLNKHMYMTVIHLSALSSAWLLLV